MSHVNLSYIFSHLSRDKWLELSRGKELSYNKGPWAKQVAVYKLWEAQPTSLSAPTALEECAGCLQGMLPQLPGREKPSLTLLFIQTHSSCLANYLGQWVPSASRVLCPHWERGILCRERILLQLHMRRAQLQACILIPFLCKGPAGGEWEEGKTK